MIKVSTLKRILFILLVLYSGNSFAYFRYMDGCTTKCYSDCDDASDQSKPHKCPAIKASSPTICKVLFGECSRLDNGKCGFRPNTEYDACLQNPSAFTSEYTHIQSMPQPYSDLGNCNREKAIQTVKSQPIVQAFCSQKINARDKAKGCVFDVILPHHQEQKENVHLGWRVRASAIHSWDEKGQPRFMPEGFALYNISRACQFMGKLEDK